MLWKTKEKPKGSPKKSREIAKMREKRPYLEQLPKIRTASGEHDPMSLEAFAIAGQCDVDEILIVSQIFESRSYAALVIVPSQAEVLCIYHRYDCWTCNKNGENSGIRKIAFICCFNVSITRLSQLKRSLERRVTATGRKETACVVARKI